MMSYAGYVPVFGVKQLESSSKDVKNSLLSEVSTAIKQVHALASQVDKSESLTEEFIQTCFLCEQLDRMLLFGLHQLQWGYWPCIKAFVHEETAHEITSSQSVTTSLGHGRSWLLDSLNGFLLEGYVRSFIQNQTIIKRHYNRQAVLRDIQCLDLLASMLAGLEFVPFALNKNHRYLDDVSAWSRLVTKSLPLSRDSGVFCSSECLELSQAPSSLTLSSMDMSFQDGDSGVLSLTNHTSASATTLASPAEEVAEHFVPPHEGCRCAECSMFLDGERIRQIINLDVVPIEESDSELEVTRVVKRKKRRKKVGPTVPEEDPQSTVPEKVPVEEFVDIESKSASENTLVPVGPRSLASSNASTISTESMVQRMPVSPSEEQVLDRSSGLPVLPCTENHYTSPESIEDIAETVKEVSIYDILYDPSKECAVFVSHCQQSLPSDNSAELTEQSSTQVETNVGPEEPLAGSQLSCQKTDADSKEPLTSNSDVNSDEAISNPVTSERKESVCDELDVVVDAAQRKKSGLDIRVENNTLLYLSLEIFETDGETLYKMFLAWRAYRLEMPKPTFVLISNKFLYLLRPGPGSRKFERDVCIPLTGICYIKVLLNYQGFTLQAFSEDSIEVSTGNAELTRNILSSLDIAIRRLHRGVDCLPSVSTNSQAQINDLTNFFTREFKIDANKVIIKDYRLVHWEKIFCRDILEAPAGPTKSGFLMWRPLKNQSWRERRKPWETGYFLLRAGVLHRFLNSNDTIPSSTYVLSSSNCTGCQQVQDTGRPYTLQLNLGSEGTNCLQLAASNENELSEWVYSFMLASEAPGYSARSVGLAACCLVLVGDLVLTLVEDKNILGRGSIVDVSAIYSEGTFCILTFESGEADSCAADWIFWFSSAEEKEDFLSVVAASWEELFQVPLDILELVNNGLRNHCLERASELRTKRDALVSLCSDS